jgi:hypothetical protein
MRKVYPTGSVLTKKLTALPEALCTGSWGQTARPLVRFFPGPDTVGLSTAWVAVQ